MFARPRKVPARVYSVAESRPSRENTVRSGGVLDRGTERERARDERDQRVRSTRVIGAPRNSCTGPASLARRADRA